MAIRQFIDQALDDHATMAAAVAARLPQGFALLADEPGEAEAFARMTEHVVLGHLDDAPALAGWIERLHPLAERNPGLGTALARSRVAVALAEGKVPGETALPVAEQVRAYGNALLALTRRSAWNDIRVLLAAVQDTADGAGDPVALRSMGAITNNLAGDLRFYHPEHASDPDYAALMVDAARLARTAWNRAGGWLEKERADYQLAMCLAAAGDGRAALDAASAAWQACGANDADDEECFYVLEALARAHCAAGQLVEAREARAAMAERLARLASGAQAYARTQLVELDRVLAGAA